MIDLIEDERILEQEQKALDEHDDEVAALTVALQQLVTAHSPSEESGLRKTVSRRLTCVRTGVSTITGSLATASNDICLLQLNEDEIKGHRIELSEIRRELTRLDLEDDDELKVNMMEVEKALFDCSLELRRLLQPKDSSDIISTETNTSKGVKLPKIDVPTFDGNILNWRTFWEQFSVAVHNHDNISDSEKLVYLRHSLRDSKALKAIEGLSRSGEHYVEAVELLQARFNRPRLIHQTHVSRILNAPSLKEGSGRELRHLHDTIQQHLRALKAMDYEPFGPFITSVLELKLDPATMFEWQKHSQSSTEVPHYQDLL